MQARTSWYATVLVAAGIVLPFGTARAGDAYTSSIVEECGTAPLTVCVPPATGNTTDIHLTKGGNSIVMKPAKAGTGAFLSTQLTVKGVDCPAEGNDGGKTGKCGPKATSFPNSLCTALKKPAPCCTNPGTGTCTPVAGALDISAHALGNDSLHSTGMPVYFSGGQVFFQLNGKTKLDGTAFGIVIAAVAGRPIGFMGTTIRTAGSDPTNVTTGCGVIPLPMSNTCLDGIPLFYTGFTIPAT